MKRRCLDEENGLMGWDEEENVLMSRNEEERLG